MIDENEVFCDSHSGVPKNGRVSFCPTKDLGAPSRLDMTLFIIENAEVRSFALRLPEQTSNPCHRLERHTLHTLLS